MRDSLGLVGVMGPCRGPRVGVVAMAALAAAAIRPVLGARSDFTVEITPTLDRSKVCAAAIFFHTFVKFWSRTCHAHAMQQVDAYASLRKVRMRLRARSFLAFLVLVLVLTFAALMRTPHS